MNDRPQRPTEAPTPAEKVDEEFTGRHGTVVRESSIHEEAHGERNPQSPGELAAKIRDEAGEGERVAGKAKRAFEELDRDISGEYERRQDGTAPPPLPEG